MPAFGEYTPGTVNVRLRTPSGVMSFDLTDFGPYPLWSTCLLQNTQSTIMTYFQYGIGSPIPGGGGSTATKLDTNLQNNAGQLSASDEMLIWAMRIIIAPDVDLETIQDLLKKTYTALYIAIQKPTAEGRIEFFPAGGGISGTSVATGQQQWTNGRPGANDGRTFASPHYLGGITTFYAQQEFPIAPLAGDYNDEPLDPKNNLRVVLVLDGLRRRPVA